MNNSEKKDRDSLEQYLKRIRAAALLKRAATNVSRMTPEQIKNNPKMVLWPTAEETRKIILDNETKKMGDINRDFGFTPEQMARAFGPQLLNNAAASVMPKAQENGDVVVKPTGYNENAPTAEQLVAQQNWEKLSKALPTIINTAKTVGGDIKKNIVDPIANAFSLIAEEGDTEGEKKKEGEEKKEKDSKKDNYDVSYTYKQGDTFGQVLKNLGLDEGNLWGDKGTVKYYSDQLWSEQPDAFDSRGNIKVGHTIKLRKRQ